MDVDRKGDFQDVFKDTEKDTEQRKGRGREEENEKGLRGIGR